MNFTKESPGKNRSKKLLFAIKRRFRVPNVRYIREAFDFVYIRSSSLCIVVMATDMTDFMAQFYCRPIFVISRENRRWTQRNDWGKIGLRIKTMCARYIFFSRKLHVQSNHSIDIFLITLIYVQTLANTCPSAYVSPSHQFISLQNLKFTSLPRFQSRVQWNLH